MKEEEEEMDTGKEFATKLFLSSGIVICWCNHAIQDLSQGLQIRKLRFLLFQFHETYLYIYKFVM